MRGWLEDIAFSRLIHHVEQFGRWDETHPLYIYHDLMSDFWAYVLRKLSGV